MTRREFPNPVKRAAHDRANGNCECHRIPGMVPCGLPLGPGNTYYEHIICDGAGGDPTLDNCAVLTKTCWRKKTTTYDQPHVAKTKRMKDRDRGIRRASSRTLSAPADFHYNWDKRRYVRTSHLPKLGPDR